MRNALRIAVGFGVFAVLSTSALAQTQVSQHLLLVDPTSGHMIKLQVPALSGPLTLNLPTTNGTLLTTANAWALGGNDLTGAGLSENRIGSTSPHDVVLVANGDPKLSISNAATGPVTLLDGTGLAFQDADESNVSTFTAGDQTANINYTLPTTQPAANDVLTATAVSGSGPYDVTLGWAAGGGADHAILSSDASTMDDDAYVEITDFAMSVAANTSYQVEIVLYNNNTTGSENTDLQLTFPSSNFSYSITLLRDNPEFSFGNVSAGTSATRTNISTSDNDRLLVLKGILEVGASGGQLQTYFKMNANEDGSRTITFLAGSHIVLRKL